MKIKRYYLLAIVLLLLLGTFLTISIISSRRTMLDLIKEQARSFLSVVASTQENLIFAEARLEDELIDKLIGACNYLETRLSIGEAEMLRHSFGFSSIVVYDRKERRRIITSGAPIEIQEGVYSQQEPISFSYYDFGNRYFMRFTYVVAHRIYQIELPADEIKKFRSEFGINNMMNLIAANPEVRYLVLQDKKGILFATPNVQVMSSIEDDSALVKVLDSRTEMSRTVDFDKQRVLELVRPFIVDEELLGIFRIGISLENYNRHLRRTESQLIVLLVILLGAGCVLFLLIMSYHSYAGMKELFDKTLGAVEDGVLLVDNKGVITGVNKMFCGLSAFDEHFLVGNKYESVLPGDPFEIARVASSGKKIADEKSIFGRTIQYTTYPLFDERQKSSGVISIQHDVSKLRDFEREREESERLLFLGNLVANFAHEIKNPLNGLSIATQRLIREFPNPHEEYIRITRNLKKEIDALNKTVNDFLVLARPKIREKIPFSIADVLAGVRTSLEHQLREFDIVLDEHVDNRIQLLGNADDFHRALMNILLNAIDAVATVKDRPRIITVAANSSGDEATMTISDNGVGMDKEEKDRVFNPYYTTKKSGTGLGLYIAQEIIKNHRGKISIVSQKNKGTTFNITFTL